MFLRRKLYSILLFGLFINGFAILLQAQAGSLPIISAMTPPDKEAYSDIGQEQAGKYETESLQLRNIRIEAASEKQDNRLHIIAVFNRRPDYSLMLLDNPPRLIVNLPATQFSFMDSSVKRPVLLQDFRYGASGAGQARLVFGLKKPFLLRIMQSEALFADNQEAGWQLVWELAPATSAEFRQYLKMQHTNKTAFALNNKAGRNEPYTSFMPLYSSQKIENDKIKSGDAPFIIVLDPGHGDFDSGAIGIGGMQEKQVTLAFAKVLYRILQEKPGIEPHLTREGDSFLRLGERVGKARKLNADLFISIHADHIAVQSLQGATIYTLSDKASDDMAKLLAERENKADLLDGLPADEAPAITDILLDMTRRETRIFSEDFARMTVAALDSGDIALIKNPHRFAGFQVLKAADIPSVLIELGYLSNMQDEKRIAAPAWQDKMAHILADVITHYAHSHGKSRAKP